MEITVITLVASICACIFSLVALILGFLALSKSIGMGKSTHSVQFQPVEDWASTEEEIKEIEEEFHTLDPLGL